MMNALTNRLIVSNSEKYRLMSFCRHHPSSTMTGVTKSAIWMDDPTATPIARSILFFEATVTAVMCSAALPTIGRMMRPTNASETGLRERRAGMLSTRNSAHVATRPVEITRRRMAEVRDMCFFLSPASLGFAAGCEAFSAAGTGVLTVGAVRVWLSLLGKEVDLWSARGVTAGPTGPVLGGKPVGLLAEKTVELSMRGIVGIIGINGRFTEMPRRLKGRLITVSVPTWLSSINSTREAEGLCSGIVVGMVRPWGGSDISI